GFAMMQSWQETRIGDQTRIGSQDARNVLPQDGLARAPPSAKQRGGEIGTAAAERRDAAVRRLSNEPGDDWDRATRNQRPEDAPCVALRPREIRRRSAVLTVGGDDLGGIDEHRSSP